MCITVAIGIVFLILYYYFQLPIMFKTTTKRARCSNITEENKFVALTEKRGNVLENKNSDDDI